MLVADRHRLRLVFQDFHAHAVRRDDERLVQPVVAAREHRHARRLPLRDPLLDVVDDEADVVHHRSHGAALALLGPKDQIDVEAREHDQRIAAGHEQLAAHGQKELLVRFDVLRGDVPVTHGHADLVERGRLRGRGACGQRRGTQERDESASG